MTAPTATIVGPLVYPGNSRKVANRPIRFRCIGPEGAVLRDSDGGMVGETTIFTDDDGTFSQVLTLNSDIDVASGVGPPGTYWQLQAGVVPAVTWSFVLDAADADGTIVIGDAAHTITDPTPRGWVPLIGPPGDKGDKGDTGTAATLAVGTVTTGAPGSSASASNSGTTSAAVLDFTIPAGQTGATGAPGGGAQVGLVKLAANFAQAPSAAAADVTGMTLTYTAPSTPVPIEIELSGAVQHSGGASSTTRSCAMQLYEGATLVGPIGFVPQGGFPATGGTVSFRARIRITPTAGAHTYKLRTYANGSADGTITWLAGVAAFNIPDLLLTIDEH